MVRSYTTRPTKPLLPLAKPAGAGKDKGGNATAVLRRVRQLWAGKQAKAALDTATAAHKAGLRDLAFLLEFAKISHKTGMAEQAHKLYQQAVQIHSGAPEAYLELARFQQAQTAYPAALASYHACLTRNPKARLAWVGRAQCHKALEQYEAALTDIDKALALDPKAVALLGYKASLLVWLRRRQEAIALYRQIIALSPTDGGAWRMLAELTQARPDSEVHQQLVDLSQQQTLSLEHRAAVLSALAASFDRGGQAAKAYPLFMRAKALQAEAFRQDNPKDQPSASEYAQAMRALYTEMRQEPSGNDDKPALFIVGMPRSGTSLLEHMLSAHTRVTAMGEVSYAAQAVDAARAGFGKPNRSDFIANYYRQCAVMHQRSAQQDVSLDKAMLNVWRIGPLALAMPQARFLHIERDPVATCWSCLRHFFPTQSVPFTQDPERLKATYQAYQQAMAYWQEQLGDRILHIDYEALTQAPEASLRRILDFCGLDFQQACLDVSANQRGVRTLSVLQVDKGIYTGSSEAWRAYEPWLQDFQDLKKL